MDILKYEEIDLAETIKRSEQDVNNVLDTVSDILNNVKDNGDEAVKSYTEKFDGILIDNLKVTSEEIEEAYDKLDEKRRNYEPIKDKKFREKKALFDFIKSKVKEYYKIMAKRLVKDENGIESINLFLNNVYKEMSKKYRNATRIYFKHPRCEVLKKLISIKKFIRIIPKN